MLTTRSARTMRTTAAGLGSPALTSFCTIGRMEVLWASSAAIVTSIPSARTWSTSARINTALRHDQPAPAQVLAAEGARRHICAEIRMRHKAYGSDSLLATKSRIVLATNTGSSTIGTCPTPGRNLSSAAGTARSIGTP